MELTGSNTKKQNSPFNMENEIAEIYRMIYMRGDSAHIEGKWLLGTVVGIRDRGYFLTKKVKLAAIEYNKDAKNPNGQIRGRFELLDISFVSETEGGSIAVWDAETFRDMEDAKKYKDITFRAFLRYLNTPRRDITHGWTLISDDRTLNLTRWELKKFIERADKNKRISKKFMKPREDVPKERALVVRRMQYPMVEKRSNTRLFY